VASIDRAVQAVRAQAAALGDLPDVYTTSYVNERGRRIEVGYARLEDESGLDWTVVVAVPRSDFIGPVDAGFRQALWLGVGASLLTLVLGALVLSTIARDLRRMAMVARRVGRGERVEGLDSTRGDELGELSRSLDEMQARPHTDRLTGLNNREAVLRGIDERIAQRRRRGDALPFAVLFADLDRFKSINDRFGHQVGDDALREMAQRLRANVRANDLVARYAGDEFIVVLDGIDAARDVDAARRKLEAALSEPLAALQGRGDRATAVASVTIGAAVFPDDGHDAATLIRHADEDMYRRKPPAA
jgi:diguanylate cyclase (GGDEF)-like protein